MSLIFSAAAWAAPLGDPSAKLILLKLANHANDTGECWPSVANICKSTGLSERTVQGKIKIMELTGIIEIARGANRSTYVLSLERMKSTPQDLPPTPQDLRPAEFAPRKLCHSTPQDLPPTPQNLRPYPAEFAALYKEPSMNHHRTINEPSMTENFSLCQEALPLESDENSIAELIYQAYPRKVAKPEALKAIAKAMKKMAPSVLLENTKAYAQATTGQDRQFIPYPATWFNSGRYGDDQAEWQKPSKESAQAKKSTLEKEYFFDESYTTEIL